MNYGGAITKDISRLLELFSSRCSERETLDWLRVAVSDKAKWAKAHGVFGHIRNKTLKAKRSGNASLQAQYRFEEVCAKTLYNLSREPAPFDPDSPYWVVPNAIALARHIGVSEAEVLACLSSREQ